MVEIRHPVPEYPRHGAVKRVIGLGGDFVVRSSPPGWPTAILNEEEERMIQVSCSLAPLHDYRFSKSNNWPREGIYRFQKATAGSKGTICRIQEIRENTGQCRWRLSGEKSLLKCGR